MVKWFIHGINGPFGIVSKISRGFIQHFYNNNPDIAQGVWKTPIGFITPTNKSIVFKQNDDVNCGVCCMIFMIDMVASQMNNTWELPLLSENTFQNTIKLGSTFINNSMEMDTHTEDPMDISTEDNLTHLYNCFREELVLIIERMRMLYLENITDLTSIEFIPEWGNIGTALSHIHSGLNFNNKILKSSERLTLATKIRKLKDNVIRGHLQKVFIQDIQSFIINFSYGGYEAVNYTLGTTIGSENDLEVTVQLLYNDMLSRKSNTVSRDCAIFA